VMGVADVIFHPLLQTSQGANVGASRR
jgi:hypothetical protein